MKKFNDIPKNYTYEIIDIKTERRINGNSQITAYSTLHEINISITIPNSKLNDKEFIKEQLDKQCIAIKEKNNEDTHIQLGDTL